MDKRDFCVIIFCFYLYICYTNDAVVMVHYLHEKQKKLIKQRNALFATITAVITAAFFTPIPSPLLSTPRFSFRLPSSAETLGISSSWIARDVWSMLEPQSDRIWNYLTGHTQLECRQIVEDLKDEVNKPRNGRRISPRKCALTTQNRILLVLMW